MNSCDEKSNFLLSFDILCEDILADIDSYGLPKVYKTNNRLGKVLKLIRDWIMNLLYSTVPGGYF
jgi:hypothetical protein